jgi:polysaccharide pyruvyl transferase WcaK-like protein
MEHGTSDKEVKMKERSQRRKKIAFFGHFDSTNFGNESSLQAILYNLRSFQPDAEVICICTGPKAANAAYNIEAIPIAERFIESWVPRSLLARAVCWIFIALPTEALRWGKGLAKLRQIDMLIVPGTGLLTDAYGLLNWGPYTLFRWSLIAKIARCKLLLVSVGAGPLYSMFGRWLVKLILSLADFRSYRDNSTRQYLTSIGFRADTDRVYPDLAFSLPESLIPHQDTKKNRRSVVGIGVMGYAGKYSVERPREREYISYLNNLVRFAEWLLVQEYDVRLLIGDLCDTHAREEFRGLLRKRISANYQERLVDQPIDSVENLLSQIVETDFVVATRFHNVLLSLLCYKPVISISFHHKCESLMRGMGLSEYCLNINNLTSDQLVRLFRDLERNNDTIKPSIRAKTAEFRKALDEQYELVFRKMLAGNSSNSI